MTILHFVYSECILEQEKNILFSEVLLGKVNVFKSEQFQALA